MTPRRTSLPGPEDIVREALPNGIVVLTRPNFSSPSVVISGYFDAGALLDPDDRLGLADFVTSALMRGTAERTFDEIYQSLESVGASLGFSSGVIKSGFSGRALAEDLPLLLRTLAEVLLRPAFPRTEMEKLRAQVLTSLAIRAQDTSDMASMTFNQLLFRGHPYSRPEDGYPETVRRITRRDLVKFHRDYYGPRGFVIAVVGAVAPEEVMRQVRRILGGWQIQDQKDIPGLPVLRPLRRTVRRHHRIPGKMQSDLVIGTNGPMRRAPEFMPAMLGNNILGQFGMMGRIGDAVREKSGMAYYAYSSLSAGIGPGSWEVNAGVNPFNIGKATDLILDELKRFVQEGVTEDELADSQENFVGRLPLSLESNGGVASALLNIERYDLGLDYYLRYEELVRAVTREDVLTAARKHIDPGRLAIAVAGP